MPDFTDFKSHLAGKDYPLHRHAKFQREVEARVALHAQYVTQSEYWNTFLQHLQAINERDESRATFLRNKILGMEPMTDAERHSFHLELMNVQGRIQARLETMELPARLIERGAIQFTAIHGNKEKGKEKGTEAALIAN